MSGTRAFLVRRLIALLGMSAIAVTALLAAFHGVSRNVQAVSDRSTPAILQVAAAATALQQSYREARGSLTGSTADVEGLGENYRKELSTANQSLAQAVKSTTGGESARQSLLTITGLVSSYSDNIEQAYVHRTNKDLRYAYLSYAETMLRQSDGDILERLAGVQRIQRNELDGQASFGWLLAFAWWVLVPVLFLALAALLLHTQRFLRHRFRRRFNPWLVSATALLLAVAPLALLASQIQDRLGTARTSLSRKDIGSHSAGTAEDVAATMRGAHWRAGAAGWIPLGGTALAALILVGLQPRIDEYRFQSR